MIRFDFPDKITTKPEADALLNQLLPLIPTHRCPYRDQTSFSDAVKANSRVQYALFDTLHWLHEKRPKIYKRCRHHLFHQITIRAEEHFRYWHRVITTAHQRENPRPPS